jgi:hypothetical protein
MLICPAEKRMTKHHVRFKIRTHETDHTMREIRAGAARRPGTSLASLSALGLAHLPGSGSRLTDKTLNRKHYCGAKKGRRQRFPTMVTKTHASEGQGVGRAGPVRCARFWSWQMTRDQEFKPLLSRCAVSAVWGLRM